MSRGITTSTRRCAAVWLVVTAVSTFGLGRSARPLMPLLHGRGPATAFADLLVQASAVVLAAALIWLWFITTVTVASVLRGRVVHRPGHARRLVLLMCGVAIVAGVTSPASAQGSDPASVLVGLSLPDRASASTAGQPVRAPVAAPDRPRSHDDRHHVVAAGDSLWSIARSSSPPGSDLDARWREIWEANRGLVGDDPDLILPGQRLELPRDADTDHDHDPHHDRHDGSEGGTR